MKVNVIDAIMGRGKTEYYIDMINKNEDKNYMVIVPFLDEVERVRQSTKQGGRFRLIEPKAIAGNKTNYVRDRLREGMSLVSTHSLFKGFDRDMLEDIRIQNYTLILDEVAEVVTPFKFNTHADEEDFFNYYGSVNDEGYLVWNEEKHPVEDYPLGSKFYDLMTLCLNGNLLVVDGKIFLWEFPVEIFKAFKEVFILTYIFDGSIQKHYFDLYDIEYNYLSVKGGELTEYIKSDLDERAELKSLINIYEGNLNEVGDVDNALSSSWMRQKFDGRRKEKISIIVKNNTLNYFKNIIKGKSKSNMWGTFKPYKSKIAGEGFTRGFVPINTKATNKYMYKENLAYVCNIYPHYHIDRYFKSKGINISRNDYALSVMLQWVWRSRIRNAKAPLEERKINIYLPSRRMRRLLKAWLNGEDV